MKYIHIVLQPSLPFIHRMFSSSQTETLYLLNTNSTFHLSPSLQQTNIIPLFLSYEVIYSGSSNKGIKQCLSSYDWLFH